MPRNGSGTYSRAAGPYVYNTVIDQDDVNAEFNDIATALTASLAKDGQTVPTANLPMGGYKLTGLGAGAADGNSLRYEQLFSTSAVTLLGAMNWVKGADIASASTINLTTATGNGVHVTGTTAITAVTLGSGMWRQVIFDGALTLTHHATTNNLPGGANITTAAGDRALYWADGTTVYCVSYFPAAGVQTKMPNASQAEMEAGTESALRAMSPLRVSQAIAALASGGTVTRTEFTASGNMTIPAGVTQVMITGQAAGGGGGGLTGAGSNGGNLTFGKNGEAVSITLTGGTGGATISGNSGGAGGAGGGSGLQQGMSGAPGQYMGEVGGGSTPARYAVAIGGNGGVGIFGNLGSGGRGSDGTAPAGNAGSAAGGGGGAGEQVFRKLITVTSGQWDVTINAVGGAGTGTGGGTAAGAGLGGFLIVEYVS